MQMRQEIVKTVVNCFNNRVAPVFEAVDGVKVTVKISDKWNKKQVEATRNWLASFVTDYAHPFLRLYKDLTPEGWETLKALSDPGDEPDSIIKLKELTKKFKQEWKKRPSTLRRLYDAETSNSNTDSKDTD